METCLAGSVPTMEAAEVSRFLDKHYSLSCANAEPLPGERDRNFLVTVDDGRRFVLKISNSAEDPGFIEAQNGMLETVAAAKVDRCPRVVSNQHGQSVSWLHRESRRHAVRLVTWIAGRTMSSLHYASANLLHDLGQTVAQVDLAMTDFDHPALHREFCWNLERAESVVASGLQQVGDFELRNQLELLLTRYRHHTVPWLGQLSRSTIHNDANDGNVIVHASDESPALDRVAGLIDFGDAVHSWTVGSLAIAIAYAWLNSKDPVATAGCITQGYCRTRQLGVAEATCLFGLACMRLCASVAIAIWQREQQPENDYLLVSQAAIRNTLPRLLEIPFEFAAAATRGAAGLTTLAKSDRVSKWLGREGVKFAFPVNPNRPGVQPDRKELVVVDLSVDSPWLKGDPGKFSESNLTPVIQAEMGRAGAAVAVGRYLEPRILYSSGQFAASPVGSERRTVHLGIDLFAPAGTGVLAPLDGHVKLKTEIAKPLDYGGLVILEHRTNDGEAFFTLYGHLDPATIGQLNPGQSIAQGQPIARLGSPEVNGGWTPHLHFQIIIDLLGLEHEFPGVGRASQQEIWSRFSPDPNLVLRIPADCFPKPSPTKSQALTSRRKNVGRGLALSYQDPLKLVRGWKQYLYDESGRQFLDAYNNVPHVGHCHPQVTAAILGQMQLLNSNTRYLHDKLNELAARIADTMPDPLEVCYLVNSASEANELALRLAHAKTAARDVIVQQGAYHGNTTTLIDISPYKCLGPGGKGLPDWVHMVPLADIYRGEFRDVRLAGSQYAETVRLSIEKIQKANRRVCAFMAESCPSVAGQILFPRGYLTSVYEFVRAAGGVCIADDVQTGYGRLGNVQYGFELDHVVPDIVVLGKPIGNGHPLGAVVTTRVIAESFDNGMEYFSTFGGNAVSCAAGLAVLDVLHAERLQENAAVTGQQMLRGLIDLKSSVPMIGDVRGQGFFLGVELVVNRESREPWPQAASYISNRLCQGGILIGTDGLHENVLKIRPPMCFSGDDAQRLIAALADACGEWIARHD